MGRIVDRVLNVVLTLAAVVLVGALLRREHGGNAPTGHPRPAFQAEWSEVLPAGRRIGKADAPVVLVEFGDFECPYCRRLALDLRLLKDRYADNMAVVYIHYPLTQSHRFALPAARAAECASEQGRFTEYHDVLFEKQDSIGLKSWDSYAVEAHVRDLGAFGKCVARPGSVPMVERGLEAGARFGVSGVPTIMINGWLYRGGMSTKTLDDALSAIMEGKEPS